MTISDVALAAGVSVGSVSKALNGRVGVSAGTRERVRTVADELGFRPNELARALPTGRSFSVGLLTTDSYGRFSIPLMLGAEDALGSSDLAVLFCDTRDDPEREARQLRMLLSRHVDGIIVNGRRTEPRSPLPDTQGVAVVYAFTASADEQDCSVVPDEHGGAAQAVEHLLNSGRRRIGHITGPRGHRSAAVRAEAAQATLHGAGLQLAGTARFGTWSEDWGRQALQELLTKVPNLDAVFCGSDQIARGVLDQLREMGRRVPDDIAVVGFDNWEVMALAARPPLTTIDMQLNTIGRTAAELLHQAIDGTLTPGKTVVSSRLIIRPSTA